MVGVQPARPTGVLNPPRVRCSASWLLAAAQLLGAIERWRDLCVKVHRETFTMSSPNTHTLQEQCLSESESNPALLPTVFRCPEPAEGRRPARPRLPLNGTPLVRCDEMPRSMINVHGASALVVRMQV